MSHKDGLYSSYFTTHMRDRKGEPSVEDFRRRAAEYDLRLKRFLPADRDSRLIDVGCGSGHLVWWLQREGYGGSEGIDISPEMVEIASRLGVSNIRQADLRDYLASRPDEYHGIFLRDILEHFSRDEILAILKMCVRSLRQGGVLVIQVPNAESPFFGRIRYGDLTHEVAFTATSMAQAFNAVGLRNPKFASIGPLPGRGLRRLVRYLMWKPVEGLYKLLLHAELGEGQRVVTQTMLAVAVK